MSIEFTSRLRAIPVYPAAATYAYEGELVKLASNETPYPPHPQVLEAVEAQLRTLNRYPDPEESLDLLGRHPNLVILRTFSKVYGLCGLRAGYALGSEAFRLAVDRVRQPFSVNALAQAAAAEALLHQDEVERRVERTAVERLHIETELDERGLESTDTQANFSWVSLG